MNTDTGAPWSSVWRRALAPYDPEEAEDVDDEGELKGRRAPVDFTEHKMAALKILLAPLDHDADHELNESAVDELLSLGGSS